MGLGLWWHQHTCSPWLWHCWTVEVERLCNWLSCRQASNKTTERQCMGTVDFLVYLINNDVCTCTDGLNQYMVIYMVSYFSEFSGFL